MIACPGHPLTYRTHSMATGHFADSVLKLCAAIVRHDQSAWTDRQRDGWVAAAMEAKIATDDMVRRMSGMQRREQELLRPSKC